jgi:hypothetical protein
MHMQPCEDCSANCVCCCGAVTVVLQPRSDVSHRCVSAAAVVVVAQFVLLVGTIGLAVYAATQVFGWNAVVLGQRSAFSDGEHLPRQLGEYGLPCVHVKRLG